MPTGNAIQSASPVVASSINVLTTAGDLLIENATPANARLPVGATGQLLGISAGLPAWQTVSWQPSDSGLIAWAYDPVSASSASNQPAAGQVVGVKMRVPAGTITNLWVGLNSAGSGLTAGQNFAGLYNSAGTLLSATADQSTAWTSGFTAVSMALTAAQVVAAGYVYVCWFANGTTIPKFQWANSANVLNANINTGATARFVHGPGGQTTSMPASLSPGASGDGYWAAVN